MDPQSFFGEVIYAYTDQMALDDGVLIDISSLSLVFEGKPINRITATLYWDMQPYYPISGFDQNADPQAINFDMEAFARAINTKLALATGHGYLRVLPPDIWLVENEVNGWTLMFPSDY
jgi:hypothetical protein